MDHSNLLLLPQELRDLIYTFTFTTSYAVTLKTNQVQHALTQTCRQIRKETLALYLSLTRFNAHLDDGPATPLTAWLETIGPAQCLLLWEVNIWDMHMLNGSLHGVKATERMLSLGAVTTSYDSGDDSGLNEGSPQYRPYVLMPVGRDIFHGTWYLAEIVLALQSIGIGLQRFCEVRDDGLELKQTSHFAIQPAQSIDGEGLSLIEQFGLSCREWSDLIKQLDGGWQMIQLQEGRRKIFLSFDEHRRLVSMRQQFIPRDEEFYI